MGPRVDSADKLEDCHGRWREEGYDPTENKRDFADSPADTLIRQIVFYSDPTNAV
jgi:hypothetical protein